MLLIQEIDLTWGKNERGGTPAKIRQHFPLSYPQEEVRLKGDVLVHRLAFFQNGEAILNAQEESRQSIEKYLPKLGFTQDQIQQEIENRIFYIKQNQFQFYHSALELNLTNLTVQPCSEEIAVTFFYDERRSGMPYRRGHNQDYCDPQSPWYGKDCLNETAFILTPGQYGRVMWNDRRTDYDTGEWYYKLHIYNLINTGTNMPNQTVFTEREPDFVYKQLAVLY